MKTRLPAPAVIAIAYLVGSLPFSGWLAQRLRGVDLRGYGTGTVSGTGLYRVAGLGPLLVGGILDVAKGAVGPLLAGRDRPHLAAVAGGSAVAGHNWSVMLGGAGGRGISPMLGAMAINGPEGWPVILGTLAAGKALRATSLGAFVGYLALPGVLARTRGPNGLLSASCALLPMLIKRVTGNQPLPSTNRGRVALTRLVFDQDTPAWPGGTQS